jgi:hypothetical protein
MWYESKMINETLDSLNEAIKYGYFNPNLPLDNEYCKLGDITL